MNEIARKREKLLALYYADALTVDIFKAEQTKLDAAQADVEATLAAESVELESIRELIELALALLDNVAESYAKASPRVRQKWNRAMLARVYVSDRRVSRFDLMAPFDTVLNAGTHSFQLLQPSP